MLSEAVDIEIVAFAVCSVNAQEIFDAGVPRRKLVDGVLNPNWWGRLLWDLFVIGLVVSDSMVLPFQLAYKDDTDMFDVAWLWTTTVFFAADIALSFLTAYVAGGDEHGARQGALITNKRRIAHNYFLTWFVIDVISTIPWGVFFAEFFGVGASNAGQVAKSTKLMKFLRFLRLVRISLVQTRRTVQHGKDAVVRDGVPIGDFFASQRWPPTTLFVVSPPTCF